LYRGVFGISLDNRYFLIGGDIKGKGATNSLMEINIENGDIISKKNLFELSDNESLDLATRRTHNGHIYVTGSYDIDGINYGLLAKFDPEGNLIWKRKFQEATILHYIWNLNFVDDGIILLGEARNPSDLTKSNAWVVKTDSFGCIIPGCQLNDAAIQVKGIDLILYPNPTSDFLNIKFKLTKHVSKYEIKATDVTGKTVYEHETSVTKTTEQVIDTRTWQNGIYIIQISSDGSIMASGIAQIIH
jgi:hypothetical protein